MSNFGKRMVKEPLIAQIGQGGGSEYTAGTGIDITEDVISVNNDVAMKTDIPEDLPTYGIKYQMTSSTTVAELMAAGMPILSTADADTDYPDNVVNIAKQESCYLEGVFAVKCQNGTGYHIFVLTDSKNSFDVSKMTFKRKAIKTGDRDFTIDDTRWRFTGGIADGQYVTFIGPTGQGKASITGKTATTTAMQYGIASYQFNLLSNEPAYDKNYASTLALPAGDPTANYVLHATRGMYGYEYTWTKANNIPDCPADTNGTYVLEATVSDGVATYNWVLKQ